MPNLNDQLGAELDELRGAGLYRELRDITGAQGPRVGIAGRELLNFSSNDYLGLANDPLLKHAATEAIARWGVGAGASRLVCGNLEPYRLLEAKLARFKNKAAAIVFGSGYAANVGTITALAGEGDVVILDKLDHASIIDGARQSGATIRVYPHLNLRKLEEILRQSQSYRRRLIITETVFSMDGDLAPLAEIVALKEKYAAWLMLDEAHATGVFGTHRRGLAEQLGVEDRIEVTLGTLSKALGCAGGFVVGSQTLIDLLRNRARSLIYSTALPPSVCAAAAAAVGFVMSAAGAQRRDRLWENVRALGAQSPIHPVIIGAERAAVELSGKLFAAGIFVPAIRYPTVPKGKARLRVTVSAAHTADEIATVRRFLLVGAASPPRPVGVPNPNRGGDAAPTETPAKPHQSALRKHRVSLPDECYFVTACTKDKQAIFQNPQAAELVINSFRWLRDQGRIHLLGFVVMPDHVHVALALCRSATEPTQPVAMLAELMQAFKSFTSHAITKVSATDSSVWQAGYYETLLRNRRDFTQRLDYIHDNPRRKGLVAQPTEYEFSTANARFQCEIDWAWLDGVAQ